jgi:hypothetical protein
MSKASFPAFIPASADSAAAKKGHVKRVKNDPFDIAVISGLFANVASAPALMSSFMVERFDAYAFMSIV